MHDLADPIEALPGVLGLAVPGALPQGSTSSTIMALACTLAGLSVDKAPTDCVACQSHRDMKLIEDGSLRDASFYQD
jgi:hypothetical protein